MSLEFYKVLHLVALIVVLSSLTITFYRSFSGQTEKDGISKSMAMLHGMGLLFALISGFGLVARLGYPSLPKWVFLKLVIWLLLGAAPVLFKKYSKLKFGNFIILLVLVSLAAYIGVQKPM